MTSKYVNCSIYEDTDPFELFETIINEEDDIDSKFYGKDNYRMQIIIREQIEDIPDSGERSEWEIMLILKEKDHDDTVCLTAYPLMLTNLHLLDTMFIENIPVSTIVLLQNDEEHLNSFIRQSFKGIDNTILKSDKMKYFFIKLFHLIWTDFIQEIPEDLPASERIKSLYGTKKGSTKRKERKMVLPSVII